jgi:uncharacterized repeat protein (TIGR03803 family)
MANTKVAGFASTIGCMFAFGLLFFFGATAAQAGEKTILAFDKTHGAYSLSGLTSDAAGNLYGTTYSGGSANCGGAFELSPTSGGKWTQTVLYNFQGCQFPGPSPSGTLVFDKQGNLYGAAQGNLNGPSGVIFQLSKKADGTWSSKTIHLFDAFTEGSPFGDLAWDAAGNLYGVTYAPYTTFSGEVFELSPQPDGSWKETVLVTFPAPNGVGAPQGGPILDSNGNLYGATFFGIGGFGSNTRGAVYELSPQANGPWTLTVVYNFTTASSSQFPSSTLTFDSKGNLFGAAQGTAFYGTIFEVSPSASGTWTAKTIHSFTLGNDGGYPSGPLVADPDGSLYGTASLGGSGCNGSLCGLVYKLTPQSGGDWKETIVHPFESANDGSRPSHGLFLDSAGNLFGTTNLGGSRYGYGTVFEITP